MRSAKPLVATGEIELMSMTSFPAERPLATPFSPNSTFSTSGVSGTMVMTTSAFSATSVAVAQAVMPSACMSAGTPDRLVRNSSWPALRRFSAMGRPMSPRPMNPTFMARSPRRFRRFGLVAVCGLSRPAPQDRHESRKRPQGLGAIRRGRESKKGQALGPASDLNSARPAYSAGA